MSLQQCSGTTGFPIKLTQNLFNAWPGGYNPADREVAKELVVATDFSVAWSTSVPTSNVTVITKLPLESALELK
jgi:hypothetical protein